MDPEIFLYTLCAFFGLLLISFTVFAYRHGTCPITIPNQPPTRTKPGKGCSRIINWQKDSTCTNKHASNNSVEDIEMQSSSLAPVGGSAGKTDGSRDYTTDTTPTEYVVFENIVRISNQGKVYKWGSYERLRPSTGR